MRGQNPSLYKTLVSHYKIRMKKLFMTLVFATLTQHLIAAEDLVEKKEFQLKSYKTVSGKIIKNLRIGYESYGKLNSDKSNAILVAHHFSGTSHAAGKYAQTDATPGYWDSIIGPGKALDTNKYFIISSDTLVNLSPNDPFTKTTGPASINPETGKPFGMSFPLVGVKDFVQVQKKLIDSLGIKKLYAVAGPSGGAAQSIEWAATYPDAVPRVIAVVPPGLSLPPYVISLLNLWSMPVKLDPKWNKGDYYDKEAPVQGVAESLKMITLSAVYLDWAQTFGNGPAQAGKDPLHSYDHKFAAEAALQARGEARAAMIDGNSILYTARAIQSFNVENNAKKIKAEFLFIPAQYDLIFPPEVAMNASKKLCTLGRNSEVFVLEGRGGHLDGLFKIAGASEVITKFLERPLGSKGICKN